MSVERRGVYRAIRERRDVRRGFLPEPIPDELLHRLLEAAHNAPSVGLMQPWRFIVVRELAVRRRVHQIFLEANEQALAGYKENSNELRGNEARRNSEAPQNLCIVCDSQSSQGHRLGRRTMPETALYSAVCAIQNLWLAARAEGIGVGWVSILEPAFLRERSADSSTCHSVAYLCLGYVDAFATEPDLERAGWEKRTPLKSVLSLDQYDSHWDEERLTP